MDLVGAIDMHVHFGPDPGRKRRVTALEAVNQASAAGHAGLVLKSHDAPKASVAAVLDPISSTRVFGGNCCDLSVGGLNARAVENALQIGAKVVWLPTFSSVQDWHLRGRNLGVPYPGISLLDEGRLVANVEEIMRLAMEYDVVLATGHISIDEHVAVAAAAPPGLKLLVTHGLETLCGPGRTMTVEILADLVAQGAIVEFCALTCVGAFATRPVGEIARAIDRLGSEHCIIASDFGQEENDLPSVGLARFATELANVGVTERAISTMAIDNPARLLGVA